MKNETGGGDLKSLIKFHRANKTENYNVGGGKKKPIKSTEQVKT